MKPATMRRGTLRHKKVGYETKHRGREKGGQGRTGRGPSGLKERSFLSITGLQPFLRRNKGISERNTAGEKAREWKKKKGGGLLGKKVPIRWPNRKSPSFALKVDAWWKRRWESQM